MEKGAGKGGKGPVGGCWICKGAHYASNCPKGGKGFVVKGGKGDKGKGKGKLGWFEAQEANSEWDYAATEEGSLKFLSSLAVKRCPVPTSNRWSSLQVEEDDSQLAGAALSSDLSTLNSSGKGCSRPAGSALSSPGLAVDTFRNAQGNLSPTGSALSSAGMACDIPSGISAGLVRDVDAALSSERYPWVSLSGGPRAILAQEVIPPPRVMNGENMVSIAKRKERQGDRKKRFMSKGPCKHSDTCSSNCGHQLNMLQTLRPAALNSIGEDGWEEIEMAVDSGASETVVGEDMVVTANLKESEGSRTGVEYKVANGESIPNLGEKKFLAVSRENVRQVIRAQVCSVQQGLLSVKKMLEVGHRVVFDPTGSYIEDVNTHEKMRLKERNGMFFLALWTKNTNRGF